MAKINCDLTDETPNLSSLGIDADTLERYRVCEAKTNLGKKIAIPYGSECTKLLNYDGSSLWDGEFTPDCGLFGQRVATNRSLVLCAHEFEALRIAAVLSDNSKIKMSAVALPTNITAMGRFGMAMLIDSLKVVADEVVVWNGTTFDALSGALEQFVAMLDETNINVASLSLARMHSPLDLTTVEIVTALNGPQRDWTPGNLTTASEIFESDDFFETTTGYSTGISGLDTFIRGLRISELVMYVAGTGVGKSTLLRQQVYHLAYREGLRVGVAFLEETKKETLHKLACIHFGLTFETLQKDPHALSDKQWAEFLKLPGTKNLHFISPDESKGGFGGLDVDTLLSTVRYLKRKHDLHFVAVDHISIMISGQVSSKEGERKDIDILMTKMAMACVMLKVGILAICHLSNPEGKPHEEGGRVFLSHMRGSGSLKQLSWCVIAQERNQQGENNRLVLVRVLKNRNGGGRTGLATCLEFTDPLLIERTDIDPNSLAGDMADGRSQRGDSGGKGYRASKHVSIPSENPYAATDVPTANKTNSGKRIRFGKLDSTTEGS